jgi:hypothetical protein
MTAHFLALDQIPAGSEALGRHYGPGRTPSPPTPAQFAVSGGNCTGYGWPESAERLTSRHLRSSPRSCSSSRIEASAAITPSGRW